MPLRPAGTLSGLCTFADPLPLVVNLQTETVAAMNTCSDANAQTFSIEH
jgi:hypothetical protein